VIERIAIVIVLATVVMAASLILRTVARRRAARAAGQELPLELQEQLPDRAPGIVYFYGAHCASCRQQGAVLDRLAAEDSVAVIRIDATTNTSLTDVFGIMTVPSTVVVDSLGTVRSVNLGLRSRDALLSQLEEPGGRPGGREVSG
jgi:thioredoxin 1